MTILLVHSYLSIYPFPLQCSSKHHKDLRMERNRANSSCSYEQWSLPPKEVVCPTPPCCWKGVMISAGGQKNVLYWISAQLYSWRILQACLLPCCYSSFEPRTSSHNSDACIKRYQKELHWKNIQEPWNSKENPARYFLEKHNF